MRIPTLLALSALSLPLGAQCQEQKLVPADGDTLDRFGYSVDVDGDRLLIPSKHEEAPLVDQGALYVYDLVGGAWVLDEKLLASDAQAGDLLGWSAGLDGDRILAGAVFHDSAAVDQGAAYLFERGPSGWSEVMRLEAPNGASGDYFGRAVALEGALALVGAPLADRAGNASGSVYVFEEVGGTWTLVQELWPADGAAGDRFGWDLDLDGERLVVGAYLNDEAGADAGAVYVFERTGATWSESAKLLPGDATGELGWAVLADQGTVVAGAPADADAGNRSGAAYVFEESGGAWSQSAKLVAPDPAANDRLGSDVAVHGDRILVGSQLDDDGANAAGSAYLFARGAGGWSLETKLVPSDAEVDARFGRYVDLDDVHLAVGAIHDDQQGVDCGATYVYRRAASWTAECPCPAGPCGNDEPFAGCANSTGGGAQLAACGSASVAADDLVLTATGLPPGFFGLVYMGGAAIDLPFGDGRRCVGSGGAGVHRFPVRNSGAAGTLVEGPGLVAHAQAFFSVQGQILPGSTWRFQAWFRDPAGPCGGGFNLSNAAAVSFVP